MLNEDKFAKLIYWIEEREHIREAKERGEPAPWTDNEILKTYKFCNVCRRDDRVSAWLIKNVYKPNENHPLLWFMAVCARWINWPPAIQELMEKGAWPNLWFDAEKFGAVIDERVKRGEKAWTGAYMITARTLPEGEGKGNWIARSTLQPLYERRLEFKYFFQQPSRTVEAAVRKFHGAFNFGSFMSGQVTADWTYTPLLDKASDLNTWAPIGPGSTRGMNRLHEIDPIDKAIHKDDWVDKLTHLYAKVCKELPWFGAVANAMDLQNCLCEYDKFCRLENGGQVRAKYQPEVRF